MIGQFYISFCFYIDIEYKKRGWSKIHSKELKTREKEKNTPRTLELPFKTLHTLHTTH